MKLSVEYPSIAYREGPQQVAALGRAIEAIGYDEIAVFDHVVMGYPHPGRDDSRYPPKMPVLEAMVLMTYLAAHTEHIGLSTEVLVLPQRQPALVAKQISTIDTLSGGRVRLGVGVGWQESEFDALHESFGNRGKRMDDAIALLRSYFADEEVNSTSEFYPTEAMAMEPKPPQAGNLPIWIGGLSKAAIRRAATLGDGWMGSALGNNEVIVRTRDEIRRQAEAAGRDPSTIGMQMMLQVPPTDEAGKQFYSDLDAVTARAAELIELEFEWLAINATAIFQAGARSVEAMEDQLGAIHQRLRSEFA